MCSVTGLVHFISVAYSLLLFTRFVSDYFRTGQLNAICIYRKAFTTHFLVITLLTKPTLLGVP